MVNETSSSIREDMDVDALQVFSVSDTEKFQAAVSTFIEGLEDLLQIENFSSEDFITLLQETGIDISPVQEILNSPPEIQEISPASIRVRKKIHAVKIPGTQEFRTIIRENGWGIPYPVIQSRSKIRELYAVVDVEAAAFAGTSFAALPLSDLAGKVALFLVCAAGLAAVIAALAISLAAGPVTWPTLLSLFTLIATACLALIAGRGVAESLNGSTENPERQGSWG